MGKKIALGFGNNVDYEIVWDSAVVEGLVVQYGIRADELMQEVKVVTERDLVVSILSFLQSGRGGERFVAHSGVLETFAERFEKRFTLGGTSVRAAIAMGKLGHTAALHLVTTNSHVRKLIPPGCEYVCSNSHDTLYPHLIIQFAKGTTVRAGDIHVCSRQANRIIYHNDQDNIAMNLHPGYVDLVRDAKVLLISGFNAVQEANILAERLTYLDNLMNHLPDGASVFYEDAGYFDATFRQMIFRVLAGRNHVVSLNEDELQAHVERSIDFLDVSDVCAALGDLQLLLPESLIVVHCMHWALAFGEDAGRFGKALRAGVTMATTRFCFGDDFTAKEYHWTSDQPGNEPGENFANEIKAKLGENVCCVPVPAVDQHSATTIGLGDAFVGGFLSAQSLQ